MRTTIEDRIAFLRGKTIVGLSVEALSGLVGLKRAPRAGHG
jgi:hypothetical protein